jgi:hypothetical protein
LTGSRKNPFAAHFPKFREEPFFWVPSAAAIPRLVIAGIQTAFREFIARHRRPVRMAQPDVLDVTLVVGRADDRANHLRYLPNLVGEAEVRCVE